jgi:hypothetical protein
MNNENKFLTGIIRIKTGDASIPNSSDNRVILFFADTSGDTKDPLALKLIKRWLKIKDEFRSWWRGQVDFKLGKTLPIIVQTDTIILALLVLVDNVMDYNALKDAMISAGRYCSSNKYNVHINKSYDWSKIEPMLMEYFVKSGVNVTVYECFNQ